MNLERIGKYQVLGEIGRGTMGTVYKALDPVLNRHVAIKTLVASPAKTDEADKRFRREAEAAARLSHPNIVTIHDFGEENGLKYMAMELLEGEDLREMIGTSKLGSLEEKLRVMEYIAAGLAFAHSKGVVHRDLKPANIHIQPNGHVKIVDFGLARLGDSEITQSGVVLGTPNYMSPEQALGDKVDARTDVFSAGSVFYEMLTNRKPFDAETTPGVLYQVVHREPIAIRQWTPEVPNILIEVVERALAKDKTQRFHNGRQLLAALRVVRQALEAGRADTATLAEEHWRASEEGRKNDSGRGGLTAPSASRPPWVEGNVALDPAAAPAPRPSSTNRIAVTTLSGRAPTERGGAKRQAPHPSSSRLGPTLLGVGLFGILGLGAFLYLQRTPGERAAPLKSPPPPDANQAQVSALTAALVETQIELAGKDLDNKSYAAAATQAEQALKLAPGNGRAQAILEQARSRQAELETAAGEARSAFEAGRLPEASQALSRVLELDPRHPVGKELNERLNSTFRARAEEAARFTGRSRAEAERARAQGQELFAAALGLLTEGDALFKKAAFVDATQRYLEARDSFERARRAASAVAVAPSMPAPPRSAVAEVPAAAPPPVTIAAPAATPEPTIRPSPAPTALSFVTAKSVVASARAGGGLTGFDTSDVKTQQIPDLAGHLEFEVDPAELGDGASYKVRVYLLNEGKKPIRLKGVAISLTLNGSRQASVPASLIEKDVAAQQRALVTEMPGTWPPGARSFRLEAVVTSERDETCTSQLSWP